MVQPIDPVLNVPSVPDLQIPSIPYKKLPFPFDDFTTLTQPDTGLTYPDSIPPTIATLAAMPHDGSQAGYLTHTDRALDVNVVNGGSGSGGKAIPKYNLNQSNFSGFGDLSYPFDHNVATIYSIVGFIHSWRDDAHTFQSLSMYINGPGGDDEYQLMQAYGMYGSMSYPPGDIMYPINQIFPNGLSIASMFSTTAGLTLNIGNGASFWGSFWVNIAYSDE